MTIKRITLHKIEGKLGPPNCYRRFGRANGERYGACHHLRRLIL